MTLVYLMNEYSCSSIRFFSSLRAYVVTITDYILSFVQPTKFEFNDPKTPFSTSPRFLPLTKVEKCRIMDAIISHGCFLRECSVQHSIVGVRSRLESGVELKEGYCIIHRAGKKGKISYEWLYFHYRHSISTIGLLFTAETAIFDFMKILNF
ncbi:hypothetical protein DVH24_008930 [Malus domestica]|uniref:glucose-1-phosphate adenylyltransferase n=1 Tax=Malus domestica TaxID=3750 RepID=A0A498JN18_MALDO|nr:hypothetical protein DVH24_008930 [Malus domestica]